MATSVVSDFRPLVSPLEATAPRGSMPLPPMEDARPAGNLLGRVLLIICGIGTPKESSANGVGGDKFGILLF